MFETVSSDTLMTWLIWIHAAILLVPLMIFTIKLEKDDWRKLHPRRIARPF